MSDSSQSREHNIAIFEELQAVLDRLIVDPDNHISVPNHIPFGPNTKWITDLRNDLTHGIKEMRRWQAMENPTYD